ncbi:hypothetical protein GCM10007916_35660 [Psychromonas marina]|uniref:Chitin-binding type-3 domain-containing protein n=2 Tax=Psychromonas marina TaxID=88364 RepID=A0ABQ6E4Z1_9GAMM|nr:hypothetical protein GCM10007916_35660 [Psychromonas marina]
MYFVLPTSVFAHGWVEYPEARQSICYEQGGLWTGNPPNAACAAALNESGTYQFIQRNEVAINIAAPHYWDINKVKAAIPDGTLCYANDSQKRGLGIAHSEWTKTEVSAGTFEFVFNATAPHNPSYWEFYLTKANADLSQPLKWDDLDLIQEYGNVVVDADKKYRMNITIPAERSGDAILYTRWQRDDTVGEGFYNCSDITITGEGTDPVDPEGPYLHQGEQFIPSDVHLSTPSIDEAVKYELFKSGGGLHASFSLTITEENQSDWDRLLASQVTGYYETNHGGDLFIGAWHEEMVHYMYFRNDLHANYLNSKDEGVSGQFTIIPKDENSDLTAVITPQVLQEINVANVEHGVTVVLHPNQSEGDFNHVEWTQLSGQSISTENGLYNELIINTEQLQSDIDHELTFKLTISNSQGTASNLYSFEVTGSDVENPGENPGGNDWNAANVYQGNDTVKHNGRNWTAQWWTQGEEPGTTGEWGVWQ